MALTESAVRRPTVQVVAPQPGWLAWGFALLLGSAAFVVLKSQAGIWRTMPSAAITYALFVGIAVTFQKGYAEVPWPAVQRYLPPVLAMATALCSLGHFDFQLGTICFELGALVLVVPLLRDSLYPQGRQVQVQARLRRLLGSAPHLATLLGALVTLAGLYLPWKEAKPLTVLVNNQPTSLDKVDPRFLAAMQFTYHPRTAFAVTWAMPAALVVAAMIIWALEHRRGHGPTWLAYAPLLAGLVMSTWVALIAAVNLGTYVFIAGLAVLSIGGMLGGISGQLAALRRP